MAEGLLDQALALALADFDRAAAVVLERFAPVAERVKDTKPVTLPLRKTEKQETPDA